MYYETSLTIPAGTTKASPVTTDLKITKGVIHRVEVEFRSGCDHLVGIRMQREGAQLYPTNPDGDFRGDGRAIVFDDHKPIEDQPLFIKIIGYSPNAAYDHVVYVRIGILPEDILTPISGLGVMFRKFFALVGIKQ